MKHKRLWFSGIFVALLVAVTVAGLELLSSLVVPPWPSRELRPIEVSNASVASTLTGTQPVPTYNSWGMRDREHPLQKPVGTFRTVLVGDSFLEGAFVEESVGMKLEELWRSEGHRDWEVTTLGISATGPPQYYYRIRNIALSLQPDALVLMFFSGNDFVSDALSPWRIPPPIAERPQPSWLGAVAPRLTWLLVNRLGLSEFGRGNKAPPAEAQKIITLPRADRLDAMVRLVKTYYYPDKDEKVIREILSRGGDTFWDRLEPRDRDEEYIQAWWLASMVDWETATWTIPLTPAELEQSVDRKAIAATMTWLLGARDLARERGIEFVVALAPVGIVDPSYAEFWAPWPKYMSYPKQRALMHRILRKQLEAQGIKVVDLEDDFTGVPNTYRVSDGHWTEFGTEIAAKRLAAALGKMREAR